MIAVIKTRTVGQGFGTYAEALVGKKVVAVSDTKPYGFDGPAIKEAKEKVNQLGYLTAADVAARGSCVRMAEELEDRAMRNGSRWAGDKRRILSGEAVTLRSVAKQSFEDDCLTARNEARRVAEMWGEDL